jgi:hypothetical protein
MLIISLGILAVLFVVGGVMDFKARRRRARYRVDGRAVHDRRYGADAAEAQMRGRIGNEGGGAGLGGGF